jgi:sugar phosphate isomerase/epimerase
MSEPAPLRWPLAGIGDEAAPDLPGPLTAVRDLDGLELRTLDGAALADLAPAAAHRVSGAVRAAGTTVVCLDSRIGNWGRPVTSPFTADLAELRALARWAHELDCPYVRIMSWPNAGLDEAEWRTRVLARTQRLAEAAERMGLVLLHENCAGWAGDRADRMMELLATVDSPALRLLFDTGNGVEHGYDSPALLAELLPWVAHVHVKDGVRTGAGTRWVPPGEGTAGVGECLRLLHRHGYAGALALEPHLATRPHQGRWQGDPRAFAEAETALRGLVAELTPVSR